MRKLLYVLPLIFLACSCNKKIEYTDEKIKDVINLIDNDIKSITDEVEFSIENGYVNEKYSKIDGAYCYHLGSDYIEISNKDNITYEVLNDFSTSSKEMTNEEFNNYYGNYKVSIDSYEYTSTKGYMEEKFMYAYKIVLKEDISAVINLPSKSKNEEKSISINKIVITAKLIDNNKVSTINIAGYDKNNNLTAVEIR